MVSNLVKRTCSSDDVVTSPVKSNALNEQKFYSTQQAAYESVRINSKSEGKEEFADLFRPGSRFEFIKLLGKGSYGVVCAAYDKIMDKNVAIKKISKLHDQIVLKRTLREIKLLRHFQNTSNIVQLFEVLPVKSVDVEEIYLVEELMDADLHSIIRSRQPLTERHFQYFMFQMLLALNEMHKANVLHRDLKPGNILVNVNCETKICDFGLARGFPSDQSINSLAAEREPIYITEYVATRWYRAPEIMLFKRYDGAADIWSLGCIFAELLNRKVLFPGKNYQDQLPKIIGKLGPIPATMKNRITNENLRDFIGKLEKCFPETQKVHSDTDTFLDYEKMFPNASPSALDLLRRMLVYEPSKRITASEALRHPYLKIYADSIKIRQEQNTNAASLDLFAHDTKPVREKLDFSFECNKEPLEIRRQLLEEISRCINKFDMQSSNSNKTTKVFQI